MYSFNNDYSEGATPEILEALIKHNYDQENGYGLDNYSLIAKNMIKKEIKRNDIDIHFIPGGTACNILGIVTCLKSYEAVIAVNSGHINVHETGAIEATGHKILAYPGKDGKLLPEEIEDACINRLDEHMVLPRMVFISNSTEIGTIYTKEELIALSNMAHKYDLYLYLDGARLASALTSIKNDLTLEDITNLVDMYYIGGTKNGALLGEAMIIVNDKLKKHFRYHLKQRGFMLAKGRLLGLQFKTLFDNNLYYDLASHANKMAEALKAIFQEFNISFLVDTYTNQLFPILSYDLINHLKNDFEFEIWEKYDNQHAITRFVCSWYTKKEAILSLYDALKKYIG